MGLKAGLVSKQVATPTVAWTELEGNKKLYTRVKRFVKARRTRKCVKQLLSVLDGSCKIDSSGSGLYSVSMNY